MCTDDDRESGVTGAMVCVAPGGTVRVTGSVGAVSETSKYEKSVVGVWLAMVKLSEASLGRSKATDHQFLFWSGSRARREAEKRKRLASKKRPRKVRGMERSEN